LTGPLAFLPLHAAGCYDSGTENTNAKIFHYAVSSYTPSLSALSQPLQNVPSTSKGILAVSQPATPGQSPLPGTVREVTEIQKQFGERPFTWLNGEQATIAAVSQNMQEHDCVHFACHGLQDASDATKSAFALQDGRLDLTAISHMSLKHARFAFLSACQTATGDEKLPEESVHLASGMLIAGYRTVLATMWSISDRYAPMVAVDVYKQLSKDMETKDGQAAYALHQAIANLRERVGEMDFLTWVPFIHLGR
jgi:CHAT domain-containing protein